MSELAPKERLQPCLLDRLTDDEPAQRQESREKRVISLPRYRDAVLRDIGWLLNSSSHLEAEEICRLERVRESVINYGLRSVSGASPTAAGMAEVEQAILASIRTFEPRVLRHTLSVDGVQETDGAQQPVAVRFEIRGELWAQGSSESLYIKTEVDLETGQCEVTRGAHG